MPPSKPAGRLMNTAGAFSGPISGSTVSAIFSQIQKMLDLLKLDKSSRVLDIGSGNGKMAEYISDFTQAAVTGIRLYPGSDTTGKQAYSNRGTVWILGSRILSFWILRRNRLTP